MKLDSQEDSEETHSSPFLQQTGAPAELVPVGGSGHVSWLKCRDHKFIFLPRFPRVLLAVVNLDLQPCARHTLAGACGLL